jgi:transposase, IS5 family
MTLRAKRPFRGLFDEDTRKQELQNFGDPLIRLNEIIDWERFRPMLTKALYKEPKGPGGRPAFDYVMMFKVLILQQMYQLSDAQMQYQLLDRLSFMRFLGLDLADPIPDEKTIWLFREKVTQAGIIHSLFAEVHAVMHERKMVLKEGVIVDATIVQAPRQHIKQEDKKQIEQGDTPAEWTENKKRQKDTDARWTQKNNKSYYGYKHHIKVSQKTKVVTSFEVTPANVHDGHVLATLVNDDDAGQELYADKAYDSKENKKVLRKYKIKYRIHHRGRRNEVESRYHQRENKKRSRVRSRVEHVFGTMVMKLHGSFLRSIGEVRAHTIIGLRTILYNIMRMEYLDRSGWGTTAT